MELETRVSTLFHLCLTDWPTDGLTHRRADSKMDRPTKKLMAIFSSFDLQYCIIISIKCWNFNQNKPVFNDICLSSWIINIALSCFNRYDKGQLAQLRTRMLQFSVFSSIKVFSFVENISLPSLRTVKPIPNDLKQSAMYRSACPRLKITDNAFPPLCSSGIQLVSDFSLKKKEIKNLSCDSLFHANSEACFFSHYY